MFSSPKRTGPPRRHSSLLLPPPNCQARYSQLHSQLQALQKSTWEWAYLRTESQARNRDACMLQRSLCFSHPQRETHQRRAQCSCRDSALHAMRPTRRARCRTSPTRLSLRHCLVHLSCPFRFASASPSVCSPCADAAATSAQTCSSRDTVRIASCCNPCSAVWRMAPLATRAWSRVGTGR